MVKSRSVFVASVLLPIAAVLVSTAVAQQPFSREAGEPILPPLIPWDGQSRASVVPKDDPWITPAEKSDLRTSPNYNDTIAWLQKLVAAAPQQLKMISIGKSSDGRDIWMVIASRDRQFTPEALRKTGKPIVLAQAGIHSGEIDGKDAGMMLLRDMTVRGTKRELLDRAHFLFVPIFNVDGHERASRFGRVNQRGPEVMGWRTTSRNLNLNRDYAKARGLNRNRLDAEGETLLENFIREEMRPHVENLWQDFAKRLPVIDDNRRNSLQLVPKSISNLRLDLPWGRTFEAEIDFDLAFDKKD